MMPSVFFVCKNKGWVLSMKQGLKFDEVIGRAKIALGISGDAELAELLNLSAKAFSNRKKHGSIPFPQLIDLLATRKLDLRLILTGEVDTRPLRDASYAATEVGLYFSPVGSGLLQDMQEAAYVEHLNAAQLRERFESRLPQASLSPQELALVDYYRTATGDDKQAILRIAALAAQSAKLAARPSAGTDDYSEEEQRLVAAYRTLTPAQRELILSSMQPKNGGNRRGE
jgi:hypothetical protein